MIFLEGKQDSKRYIETLQDYLLPVCGTIAGQNCVFQQDPKNSILIIRLKFQGGHHVVRGSLVRMVYCSRKQYCSRMEKNSEGRT